MSDITSLIRAKLAHPKTVGDEIYADCPFCKKPVTEMKFHWHPAKGVFVCHSPKCPGGKGANIALAKQLGIRLERNAKSDEPTWIYTDENGNNLYGVKRYQKDGKKQYAQYHWANGLWKPGLNGTQKTLYRLPDIKRADTVFVVEGEKCADALRDLGVVATTNSGGAGKWDPRFSEHLRKKTVYILPDNDEPGKGHAENVFSSLFGIAHTAKIVTIPGLQKKGDVADWIQKGGTLPKLLEICEGAKGESSDHDLHAMESTRHKRMTDTGNAEQFVARYMDSVRFCHEWQTWLIWDGARWLRDKHQKIQQYAKETVDEIWNEVKNFKGDSYATKLKAWAKRSRNHGGRSVMVKLAESEPAISISHVLLDTHKNLLNLKNGILDLDRGKLISHSQDLLLTKLSPVEFDPKATAPIWKKFISQIFDGDRELIDYIQKAAGYSLTGYTGQQCLFFCYGTGANGKSVFVGTMLKLLGEYAEKTAIDTIMARDGNGSDANPALVALQSARMVVTSETEEGKRWNESLIKDMTGEDPIMARDLYSRPIVFRPEWKLWVYGNHRPPLRGTDYGIRRRIKLLPFTVTIPAEKRDEKLPAKLEAELSGILNWALEGWQRVRKEGMQAPAIVEDATENYFRDADLLQDFLDECVKVNKTGEDFNTIFKLANTVLYGEYVKFNEIRRQPALSHKAFTQRMIEKGFRQDPKVKSRPWVGLTLTGERPG